MVIKMKVKYKFLGLILLLFVLSSYIILLQNNNTVITSVQKKSSNWTIGSSNSIPENVEITKTETLVINLDPFGNVLDKRITVKFEIRNLGNKNVSFQLTDRIKDPLPDTFKILRGSFDKKPKVEFIDNNTYGYMTVRFPNLTIPANMRKEFSYVIKTTTELPCKIISKYYVNDTLIELNESQERPKIKVPVGSKITQVIHLESNQKGMFGTNTIIKEPYVAIITVVLPYSSKEEERDISEPEFSVPPVMQNYLSFVQQISWLAITDNFTANWSAKVLRGGGWGILELQPMMVTISKSSQMTSGVFDALSGALGMVAALQGYWVGLVVDSLIENFMALSSWMQYVYEVSALESSITNMGLYSMVNNLLVALFETNIMANYINNSIDTLNDIADDVGVDQGLLILGVVDNLETTRDYLKDVERRIIASFGAQTIELLGNPAVITIRNITISDIMHVDYLFLNATISILPDNTTDFYTRLEIVNLTSTSQQLENIFNFYLQNVSKENM